MEDDRIELNNEPEGPKKRSKIVLIGGGFLLICFSLAIYAIIFIDKPKSVAAIQPEAVPVKIAVPIESKEQYIKSAKKMGGKQDPVYIKEFLKNPDKFKGVRLNVVGKIMTIEEKGGETFIQAYINRDYDVAIVHYSGTMNIYKDDFIRIYGEGAGTFEGQNRMGAEMSWPVIQAKYIKKMPPREE